MDERSRGQVAAIVIVLSLCGTVVSLMQTLVVPLLTDLPDLLDTSAESASWLVTSTLLTGAVATPIIAKLADMFGKRRMMLLSLVVLVVGSVLGALSDSLAGVIVARGLQGFASALIPVGISIMRDELPPARVGGGVALMSATLGIGGAVGLPLSGLIYASMDWHAVFWVSAVMGSVMLAAVLLVVPESTVRSPGRFDWPGAVLLSVALTGLLLGLSKGGQWGWTSQATLVSFLVAALVFGLWGPWELRTGQPLVDLRTSARRPVLLTNLASLAAGFAMFANMLISTQQFQLPVESGSGFGLSVMEAGLGMLPGGLLMVALAPVSASLTQRYGARTTLVVGLSVMGLGYVLRVFAHDTVAQVVVGAAIISVGTAVSFAAMPILIMRFVPITETAAANGLNTLVRAIGTSTSSAATAAILAGGTVMIGGVPVPSAGSLVAACWLAGVASFVGAGIALLLPGPAESEDEQDAAGVRDRQVVRRAGDRELVSAGRVVRPDGKPARLAVVSVLRPDGTAVDWARADNEGHWSVVVPGAGRYLVVCSAEGWAPCSRLVDLDGSDAHRLSVADRLTVLGVVSRRAAPIAGALVVLTGPTGETVGTATTDLTGHYRLAMPPLGRYVLTVLDKRSGMTESAEVVITAQRRRFDVELGEPWQPSP